MKPDSDDHGNPNSIDVIGLAHTHGAIIGAGGHLGQPGMSGAYEGDNTITAGHKILHHGSREPGGVTHTLYLGVNPPQYNQCFS